MPTRDPNIPDTVNPEVEHPSSPMSFKVMLAALTFAAIALFAALINTLSQKQAPPNQPLEEKSTITITPSPTVSPRP